jgi:RiboL-PSP-HEPN
MLYAHYEGYCKFALIQYVRAVNQASIKCEDATPAIVAGAWSKVFRVIESGDQKASIFKNSLPDDAQLHRFARRRDFIEQFSDFTKQVAQISEDTIDTESNLWPIVMQKNLYLLGLNHDVFSKHNSEIRHLINRRNNIAQGADKKGLTEKEYERLESSVFKIMDDLMDIIIEVIQNERYRR